MFCENCGTEIMEGTGFCPKCGAQIVQSWKAENRELETTEHTIGNESTEKRYTFDVSRRFAAKRSTVEVQEDRLRIMIGAQVREVMLSDIQEIKLSSKLPAFYVFLIILLLLGSLAKPWLILLALVDLWAGLHTRITILKENGEEIILHSIRKKAAEDFREDMRKLTGASVQ
ncbi:MAG TPA: hypothetical protein DDY31_12425 [Lachnospiraceae bacterium]|nr:hypothetical protein [Lachnospiraceae bacterium]HBI61996.1 hypothetical protein [Lachnospiraceae bacterium]